MSKDCRQNKLRAINRIQISGVSCDLCLPADYHEGVDRYPVLYVNGEIPIEDILRKAVRSCVLPDFILLAVHPLNWNDDFTPWSAPAFGKGEEAPKGQADIYLRRLVEEIKPYMDEHYRTRPEPECTALFGYSLGGLAAVYSLYRTERFGVVGSLSGSLWYDGFCEFVQGERPLRQPADVYLSLGKKEKLSRNPRMAKVAECTEKVREHLEKQGNFVSFEWNEGGHFHDIADRYARAIIWWIRKLQEN